MPPSIFCPDTTWTGTQILLSEQHCPIRALFYIYLEYMEELLFDEYAEGLKNVLLVY